jgi:signal transduction histidine kinase
VTATIGYGAQRHASVKQERLVSPPGIPQEKLEEVFEPFTRLEMSRNPDTGGVGLGLAVARSCVRAHGGDVILSNIAEHGLRAEIILPA